MSELTPTKEWIEMRDNIRRAVDSLELCWRCQRVSECQKYILGNTILVWLCKSCLEEMEQPRAGRGKSRSRNPLSKLVDSEGPF